MAVILLQKERKGKLRLVEVRRSEPGFLSDLGAFSVRVRRCALSSKPQVSTWEHARHV